MAKPKKLSFYRDETDKDCPFELCLDINQDGNRKTFKFWTGEKMADFFENIEMKRANKKRKKKKGKK